MFPKSYLILREYMCENDADIMEPCLDLHWIQKYIL